METSGFIMVRSWPVRSLIQMTGREAPRRPGNRASTRNSTRPRFVSDFNQAEGKYHLTASLTKYVARSAKPVPGELSRSSCECAAYRLQLVPQVHLLKGCVDFD